MPTLTSEVLDLERIEERPYMTHHWVDGPGLRVWLEAHGVRYMDLPSSDQRRLSAAKTEGGCVSVWVVDRILTRADLHLSDLPDELWRENRAPMSRPADQPITDDARAQAIRDFHAGVPARELARRYGVSPKSIYHWAGPRPEPPELDPRAVAHFLREPERFDQLTRAGKKRVGKWCRGECSPRLATVQAILASIGLTMDHLPSACWARVSASS